jgi:hypothetical protein
VVSQLIAIKLFLVVRHAVVVLSMLYMQPTLLRPISQNRALLRHLLRTVWKKAMRIYPSPHTHRFLVKSWLAMVNLVACAVWRAGAIPNSTSAAARCAESEDRCSTVPMLLCGMSLSTNTCTQIPFWSKSSYSLHLNHLFDVAWEGEALGERVRECIESCLVSIELVDLRRAPKRPATSTCSQPNKPSRLHVGVLRDVFCQHLSPKRTYRITISIRYAVSVLTA